MRSVVRSDWFEIATERIEEFFDNATYVVDGDLDTYVLTPHGWRSFGSLGSPDFYCHIHYWERWKTIAEREEERLASFLPDQITENERSSPFTDINGLVADFLHDVGDRPIPHGAELQLAEIREAVAEGSATVEMALKIVELFPNCESV